MKLPQLVAVVLLAGVVAACGTEAYGQAASAPRNRPTIRSRAADPASEATGTTGTTTSTAIAQSPAWADEGAQIIQWKQTHDSTLSQDGLPQPENSGLYAYQSLPFTVSGGGDITVDFGPVADSFDWPTNPDAVEFTWPDDMGFQMLTMDVDGMVTIDGSRYLQATFEVYHYHGSPYSSVDLTGWVS
jgi:hypothetical protein